jgi:tetratricopeptide (TPR) repeat protein
MFLIEKKSLLLFTEKFKTLKMKRFFWIAFAMCLAVFSANAQDGKKLLKNAAKNMGKYYLDPVGQSAVADEAMSLIGQAFDMDATKIDPEAWNMKGQVLNEIARAEITRKVQDNSYKIPHPDASRNAQAAFLKAMELATKKGHTKDALAGLKDNEELLNNLAITFFQDNDYPSAFENFAATLVSYDVLSKNKEKSRLDDPAVRNDQLFYTGVCAYFSEDKEKCLPYFQQLYKEGNAQPLVYEALFTLTVEKNEAEGMKYLEAGRKAHPDDNGLLFAEINYYLRGGRLDDLVGKLKMAIEKEPENVSVYNTLGNVYDQLNQKERAAKNIAKADEYFNLAYSYFEQALGKDPKNFDAVYSQGALYYNKAAGMSADLNEVANDYSSAGTKKYNAIKAEMDGYFEKALPYFLKAEQLNPKDMNTLIACKEIYARKGDFTKSDEYKLKMENLKK